MNVKLFIIIVIITLIKFSSEYKINSRLEKPLNQFYALKIKNEKFIIKDADFDSKLTGWTAKALIDNLNYNKTGWSILEIETNENVADEVKLDFKILK
jgi:hypothetical protein